MKEHLYYIMQIYLQEEELEWDTNPYLNITNIDQFNETDSDVFTMLDKIVCTFDTSNPEFSNSVRYVSLGVILLLAVFFPLFWESLFELCKEASVIN